MPAIGELSAKLETRQFRANPPNFLGRVVPEVFGSVLDTPSPKHSEKNLFGDTIGKVLALSEFELLIENALRRIPLRFRRRMNNVAIVVEKEPPRPGLLGLYQGHPLTSRSVSGGFTMPDKITIFQGPHERLARTPAELEEMVFDTVWHEIAHHFGMDEPQVRRAERRRRN